MNFNYLLNLLGVPIFVKFAESMSIDEFYMANGPMIFFKLKPLFNDECASFYLKNSQNPHTCPKQLKLGENMTVDELSYFYKYQHSSLMEESEGYILRLVDPNAEVCDVLKEEKNYRLDKLDYNKKTAENYEVSVRFKNGGDIFIWPMLIWAKRNETINSFSKKLLQKMLHLDSLDNIIDKQPAKKLLDLLTIDIGSGLKYKCNSRVKIKPPEIPIPFPTFTVDTIHLPDHLKYCNNEFKFHIFSRYGEQDRIRFKSTRIKAKSSGNMASVLNAFIKANNLSPKSTKFFSSRGKFKLEKNCLAKF